MSTEGYHEMLSALPPDTMHAEPETMVGFLTRLRDTYGSVDAYARAAGVSEEAIDGLRARLLESSRRHDCSRGTCARRSRAARPGWVG